MNAQSYLVKAKVTRRMGSFCPLIALAALSLSARLTLGAEAHPIQPPDQGQIPVAFLISDGAVVIDFCGPWEVFQDVMLPSSEEMPFRLYTVAETKKPIRTSG